MELIQLLFKESCLHFCLIHPRAEVFVHFLVHVKLPLQVQHGLVECVLHPFVFVDHAQIALFNEFGQFALLPLQF